MVEKKAFRVLIPVSRSDFYNNLNTDISLLRYSLLPLMEEKKM